MPFQSLDQLAGLLVPDENLAICAMLALPQHNKPQGIVTFASKNHKALISTSICCPNDEIATLGPRFERADSSLSI